MAPSRSGWIAGSEVINAIVVRCILDTNIALWDTRTASAPSILLVLLEPYWYYWYMNPVSYILSFSRLTISNSFWTFLAVQALTCQYPPPQKKSCLFLIISLPRDRVAPNMPKVHKKQKGRAEIKAEFRDRVF